MKNKIIGLEFGCGDRPRREEYDGVDIRSFPNVKYVCNAWEITEHVEPESVDAIFSRHFLEHLTFYDANRTIKAWHTILKNDGVCEIIVPNLRLHIEQFLDPNRKTKMRRQFSYEAVARFGFWGHQKESEKGLVWDVHKSGYDFELLKDILLENGFKSVKKVKSKPKNLTVIANK
jgi:predicted SAM-dependent methyltransferase